MKHQLWRRAREIFESLLDLPTGERERRLRQATAGDTALIEEVRSLLVAHDASPGFLETPFAQLVDREDSAPADPSLAELPQSVGHYRIERLLGRGGMGSVFLASRDDDEYRGLVAIKILRHDLANEELARRFRSERQILADLAHPNVARLLDGGSTEDGRPYLVMEYIEGKPIGRFCTEHRLCVADRLELLRKVCGAVHAAHQRLVVHRDLKPGNILVDRNGEPKLLDFGIAKPLRQQYWAATLAATAPGLAPMTLEYASPEQLRNQPITTASDIYSLGVVLYELLAGRRPFRFADQPLDHFLAEVCEAEPAPPSTAIDSAAVATEPRQLKRQLAGDLDNIVLMALRKDPQRRYSSATALARDLERHGEGRPVTARPDTFTYRTGKFVRRHRWAVAATGAAALAFLAFTVALFFQQRLTLRQKARAEEVTVFLTDLFKYADPERARGETITVREVLDRGARDVEERLDDSSLLKAELRGTFSRVYQHLGLFDRAAPLAEGAYALNLKLQGDSAAATAASRQLLADLDHERGDYQAAEQRYRQSLAALGPKGDAKRIETGLAGLTRAVWFQGRQAEAEELQLQALELAQELYGPLHERVAANQHQLAELMRERSAYDEAETHYLRALDIYRDLYGKRHPEIARLLSNLGLLEQERGALDAAEARYREAVAMRRSIYGDRHPAVAETAHSLADVLRTLNQLDEAEELCREALAIRRQGYGENHPLVAHSINLLGLIIKGRGRPGEAAQLHRQALAMWLESLDADHPWVAAAHNNLASALQASGERPSAREHYEAALTIYRQIYGDSHMQVATVLNNLATLHKADGDLSRAESRYREALDILRNLLGDEHINVAGATLNLATLQLSLGEPAKSEALYRQALPTLRSLLGQEHSLVALCLTNLGRALLAQGKSQEAEASVVQAVEIYRSTLPEGHLWRLVARGVHGEILTDLEQYPAAERVLLAAHAASRTHHGDGSKPAQAACRRLAELYEASNNASAATTWRRCSGSSHPVP